MGSAALEAQQKRDRDQDFFAQFHRRNTLIMTPAYRRLAV